MRKFSTICLTLAILALVAGPAPAKGGKADKHAKTAMEQIAD